MLGRQRRAGAQEARAAVLERLHRRDAHQGAEQRRRPGEQIDPLLAQQLGDSLRRHLVFEEQGGAVGRARSGGRSRSRSCRAAAASRGCDRSRWRRASCGSPAAAASRLADVLMTPLGSPPTLAVSCTTSGSTRARRQIGQRGALVEPAGEQGPLQPTARFGDELRRRSGGADAEGSGPRSRGGRPPPGPLRRRAAA